MQRAATRVDAGAVLASTNLTGFGERHRQGLSRQPDPPICDSLVKNLVRLDKGLPNVTVTRPGLAPSLSLEDGG